MVQAAIKAVPLGQSAGQRILAQLTQTYRRRLTMPWPCQTMGGKPFPHAGHSVGPA
jgi:hypothetical protein